MASNSADCFASCGDILSTEGAATLAGAIDELNSGLCAGFEAGGCPLIVPPCVPTGTPLCIAGSCADSFSTGENLSCDERAAEASRRVEEAALAADRSCATDADCTHKLSLSGCHGSCDIFGVSLLGAEALQAAIDELDAGFCATFADQCGLPPRFPCPPPFPFEPSCISGQCTGDPSCAERADEASQRMQDAVAAADRSCAAASDCVAISNTSNCQYGCGVVLSVDGAAALQATIEELNSTICEAYDSTCPPPIPPPCPFPGDAACIDGQCAHAL
jgi:hypothetical protein